MTLILQTAFVGELGSSAIEQASFAR